MIRIQILDTMVWLTVLTVDDNHLPVFMQQVKDQYPTKRVRAIDDNGRVMDIL